MTFLQRVCLGALALGVVTASAVPGALAATTWVSNRGYVKSIYVEASGGFAVELDGPTLCPATRADGGLASTPKFWVKESVSSSLAVVMGAIMGSRKLFVQSMVVRDGLSSYCSITSLEMLPPF